MLKGVMITHSKVTDGNLSYLYGTQEQVQANREKFLAKHGLMQDTCVALNLKHTSRIAVVDKSHGGKGMYSLESGETADAMMTNDKNVALFLLTADCLPVVLYDSIHRAVALVHVSKINVKKQYLPQVMRKMAQVYGSQPQDIEVYIGPCIHKASYDFDLVGENVEQLLSIGVDDENIHVSPVDTFTSLDYFSHRRSIVQGEPEGRFATVVKLKV